MTGRWLSLSKKLLSCVAVAVFISATAGLGQANAPLGISEAASVAKVPDWQTTAGEKAEFEVSSVKEDPSGKYSTPPYSLDSDDDFRPTGGLFNADAPLTTYISFAYKLSQMHPMLSALPEWAKTRHFVIDARATGNPTKDQLRLMMQSLLANRFKLAIHFEAQQTRVLIMTLIRPGKLGPRLRFHSDGPPCEIIATHTPGSTVNLDMFRCNSIVAVDMPENGKLVGGRNTTAALMGTFFTIAGHIDPIVDRTGIDRNIDFSMEYIPEQRDAAATAANSQASLPGATFLQAVKDQLGLKLEPAKVPLPVPVVDHVEMPSAN